MNRHPDFVDTVPFTLAQGLEGGLTRRQIESAAYRKLGHNAYVAAHIPDTLVVRCKAVLLTVPSATFSHQTAASLWGASFLMGSRIHVAFNKDVRLRAPDTRPHRLKPRLDRTRRHGLPVTTAPQTFIHLARWIDLPDLVAFGDRLCKREGGVTAPSELVAYVEGWDGQCRAEALAAARLVRARTDSVTETKLRLLMVLAGLPEPVVNHPVAVDDATTWFLDLAYPEVLLAIEYDGRWHDAPEQKAKDRIRRERLRLLGWTVIVLTAADVFDAPEATLHRITGELVGAGSTRPIRLSDAWRPHFAMPVSPDLAG